jgi:hypothetical protein
MTGIRNPLTFPLSPKGERDRVSWELGFGIYLGFACLPVGREFGIWNFETYTRHG